MEKYALVKITHVCAFRCSSKELHFCVCVEVHLFTVSLKNVKFKLLAGSPETVIFLTELVDSYNKSFIICLVFQKLLINIVVTILEKGSVFHSRRASYSLYCRKQLIANAVL